MATSDAFVLQLVQKVMGLLCTWNRWGRGRMSTLCHRPVKGLICKNLTWKKKSKMIVFEKGKWKWKNTGCTEEVQMSNLFGEYILSGQWDGRWNGRGLSESTNHLSSVKSNERKIRDRQLWWCFIKEWNISYWDMVPKRWNNS